MVTTGSNIYEGNARKRKQRASDGGKEGEREREHGKLSEVPLLVILAHFVCA